VQNKHIFNLESSLSRTLGWNHYNPQISLSTAWPVLTATPTEDGSGDLVAFLAALVAAVLLCFGDVRRRVFQPGRYMLPTILSSAAGLVLAVTLLKWQPWGARLQLISLLPLLACVAVIFGSIGKRTAHVLLTSVFVGVTLVLTPLALLTDIGKPVLGSPNFLALPRDTQMFRWCPYLQTPYMAAVHDVAQDDQQTLGYMSQDNDFEYPLWALLSQQAHGKRVEVDPVFANDNDSTDVVGNQIRPRVVLVSRPTAALVAVAAKPLVRSGYRRQSVTNGGCTTVGIYTLPKA
jgi:hypothetical protein